MSTETKPMRVAFVDLVFSWPPNGGADADVFQVISGLARRGVEVHLFVAHERGSMERGNVQTDLLPFPVTVLDFDANELRPDALCARFRAEVDAWRPDVVFLTHGFALKPYLARALAHHKLVGRFYAHELACARDALRFKDARPCPNDYLRTPDICRACALEKLGPEIRSGHMRTWASDWVAAEAWRPEYHRIVLESLQAYTAVIVSNTTLRAQVAEFTRRPEIFPGGAPVHEITPVIGGAAGEPKIILMTGRVEDPLKGLDVLRRAGEILAATRSRTAGVPPALSPELSADFEIHATHFDVAQSGGHFKALGWLSHEEALTLYQQAAVVVVPSVWEEPFGLVAVEAMATGVPVCASRVGGLADIVRHGETGFLFTPGDAAELAEQLNTLLEDAALRYRLGEAGRRVAEREYDWDVIIEQRYLPFLRELMT
jgi:glycosyltransferase involved in cell wall biosynthesis